MLADQRGKGKQVEFLPENGKNKQADLQFDDKTWDVKYINHANENTIRSYIKDARKADRALFYWDEDADKFNELKNAVHRSVGYFNGKGKINEMPDIYYINKEGVLNSIFIKQLREQ